MNIGSNLNVPKLCFYLAPSTTMVRNRRKTRCSVAVLAHFRQRAKKDMEGIEYPGVSPRILFTSNHPPAAGNQEKPSMGTLGKKPSRHVEALGFGGLKRRSEFASLHSETERDWPGAAEEGAHHLPVFSHWSLGRGFKSRRKTGGFLCRLSESQRLWEQDLKKEKTTSFGAPTHFPRQHVAGRFFSTNVPGGMGWLAGLVPPRPSTFGLRLGSETRRRGEEGLLDGAGAAAPGAAPGERRDA